MIAIRYLFRGDNMLTTCSVFYPYSILSFTDILTTSVG